MNLSIIVPAYNEAEVIQSTLKKISEFLNNQPMTYEIIVVNDGSTDATADKVRELNFNNLVLLENGKNLGKGAAVKKGVLVAQGDYLLFLDADYSTAIDNLPKFLDLLISQKADLVIASRALAESVVKIHQSRLKEVVGKLGNWPIRLFLVKGIKDTQCGFKLFKRSCLPLFKLQRLNGFGFDFEILFLAQKFGYKIVEAPVIWTNRSISRVKFIDYFKTLGELLTVAFNNLTNKYQL